VGGPGDRGIRCPRADPDVLAEAHHIQRGLSAITTGIPMTKRPQATPGWASAGVRGSGDFWGRADGGCRAS
jgi:hypothetical protein